MSDFALVWTCIGVMALLGILFGMSNMESPGICWMMICAVIVLALGYTHQEDKGAETPVYIVCDGKLYRTFNPQVAGGSSHMVGKVIYHDDAGSYLEFHDEVGRQHMVMGGHCVVQP